MIYPVDSAIQLLKNWNENTQLIKMGYTKKNNSIVTIVTWSAEHKLTCHVLLRVTDDLSLWTGAASCHVPSQPSL